MRISALFLALFLIADTAHPAAPADCRSQRRVIIERKPAPETAAKLRQAFERASQIVMFHTPESRISSEDYSKEAVRRRAGFIDVRICQRCELTGRGLLDDLARGLRIRGDCPGPLTTAVELQQAENVVIAAVYFSSDGKCFEFEGRSYAQTSRSLSRRLRALSNASQ